MAEPLSVFLVFARLGLLSFGAANLAEMERQLVRVHGWISTETFVNGYALGQFVPGPNVLAVLFYGYAHLGWLGAACAVAGFFGPSALLAAGFSRVWTTYGHRPWVKATRNALLPFGAGVLLAVVLVLARGAVTGIAQAALAALALLVLLRRNVSPALVVLLGAVAGYLLRL